MSLVVVNTQALQRLTKLYLLSTEQHKVNDQLVNIPPLKSWKSKWRPKQKVNIGLAFRNIAVCRMYREVRKRNSDDYRHFYRILLPPQV